MRLIELKQLLISREYRERTIDDAISKVLKMDRRETLKKVMKKENDRPVFVMTFNPALPSVTSILKKHWGVMVDDPYLKTVFPKPPMVAFRRTTSLKKKLVKAKVPPPPTREKRKLTGMKKCNKPSCETCPYVKSGNKFKSSLN